MKWLSLNEWEKSEWLKRYWLTSPLWQTLHQSRCRGETTFLTIKVRSSLTCLKTTCEPQVRLQVWQTMTKKKLTQCWAPQRNTNTAFTFTDNGLPCRLNPQGHWAHIICAILSFTNDLRHARSQSNEKMLNFNTLHWCSYKVFNSK